MSDEVNNMKAVKTFEAMPEGIGLLLWQIQQQRDAVAKHLADLDESIRLGKELCDKIIVQNRSDYWTWDNFKLNRFHEFGNLLFSLFYYINPFNGEEYI
jgi:hypothetical protein